MNQSRKKICWVVASPLTIHFFLMGHIAVLSREFELTIITSVDDPNFLKTIEGNIKVISLPIERNVSVLKDFKNLVQLFFIFRRERYDLIHSLSPKTGLLGMIAAWLARAPLRVHTFQGEVWITRTGLWRALLKTLDTIMARCANHLLAVSRSEENFLVHEGVVCEGRLKLLANGSICGVDVARFRPDPQARAQVRTELGIADADRVILYVGRFNVDKGLLDLAQAFVNISAVYPNTHLLLVGPDEENIQSRIEKICEALAYRPHFVGYTAEPERYMAASDFLCLPSYREGLGMVLLEAAAMGLPTIGSRIYGISDALVDGHTGLLFTVADVDDLTAKLICLLDNPLLARQMGDAGQARVRKDFDSHAVSSALLEYYQALLCTQVST